MFLEAKWGMWIHYDRAILTLRLKRASEISKGSGNRFYWVKQKYWVEEECDKRE